MSRTTLATSEKNYSGVILFTNHEYVLDTGRQSVQMFSFIALG